MVTLGIGKKYLRFFVRTTDERWVLLQGGRRSGKSFACHKWIHFLASCRPITILCVAATYPALQWMIDDFKRATGLEVTGSANYGFNCLLSNGSRYIFKAFDNYTKVQGTTCDVLYLEEALNISTEIINTLSMSVTGQIFACFNPTRNSDIFEHSNKNNLLVTTWKDNSYLTDLQIEEFENIKKRALRPCASIMDEYAYRVYYLGEFANMSGRVFPLVYTIDGEEFDRLPVKPLYGLDFGFVESKDQTAMVAIKIFNNCLYVKELIYDNADLTSDKKLAFRIADLGSDLYDNIVADYGGLGKTRIHNLVTAMDGTWVESGINHGFSIMNAKKGKVVDGIQKMLNYDKIFVTDTSVNLRRELDGYELNAEGKPKGDDHLIDATRYAVTSWSLVND